MFDDSIYVSKEGGNPHFKYAIMMNSKQEHAVKTCITMSLKVIRMYDWLLDLFVLDHFVDNHWEKLPAYWRDCFLNMDPQDFGKILSKQPTIHVLPLSFLALLKSVETLSLPRESNTKLNSRCITNEDTCADHPKLKNLFLKHVKLKKRHEISVMAEVVKNIAIKSNCDAVIDFGSGLGHLVRVLAYKNGLYAAGIECQTQLTEEARKHDLQLEYTASKHLTPEHLSELRRPTHFNITLSTHQQLFQLPLPDTMTEYGLVGLHPCGDLGPLLLRHFTECNMVKFICLVGCCFMKLSRSNGYPMSGFVNGLDSELSYVSREIACHAIEVYRERLCYGNYENLKVHAYRAALERILVEHDPELKHAHVRNIKHYDTMTFQKYCTLALVRLNIPLPTSQETWLRGESDLQQWRHVVIVYTLRLALAPLVESVILLDRMMFVLEQGLSCEIHPVFDPKISPRNHIIIARR